MSGSMHDYHYPSEIRLRAYLLFSLLSVISAWILFKCLTSANVLLPWWIDTPSVLGFLGIYIWIYDHWFWRKWPFNKLSYLLIPDISGEWSTEQESSHGEFDGVLTARCVVRQTAMKISISIDYDQSHSYSRSAAFFRKERFSPFELEYRYISYPKPGAPESMETHQGVVWLRVSENLQELEGEYFTGRGRQSYGSIRFLRQ
jgi:hypothetical protein